MHEAKRIKLISAKDSLSGILKQDDFGDMVKECERILDESMAILADAEFDIEMTKEDAVEASMTRQDLVNMAHDVAESVRIKRAESSFVKRHLN